MKINVETKYNIGDEVFVLLGRKIQRATIKTISIVDSGEGATYSYMVEGYKFFKEEECFDTQEELIEAIKYTESIS